MTSSADDTLFQPIKPPDGIKIEHVKVNEQIEFELETITRNGNEIKNVKKVIIKSKNSTVVIVDGNTVYTPPVYDEYYD
jgi:hypothetical protein